ncbi:hypothetical protein [Candidatus Poriferisodalis sp.]|uniref:hypothetical protein n=1 Tax=Candidatus Poriferisodalis sp. TaxID=3101277 RepID=UPI003B018535
MIIPVRLSYCERTRSYLDRRVAKDKTNEEKPSAASSAPLPEKFHRNLRADLATSTNRT